MSCRPLSQRAANLKRRRKRKAFRASFSAVKGDPRIRLRIRKQSSRGLVWMLRKQAEAMNGLTNLESHRETCLEAANRIEELAGLK